MDLDNFESGSVISPTDTFNELAQGCSQTAEVPRNDHQSGAACSTINLSDLVTDLTKNAEVPEQTAQSGVIEYSNINDPGAKIILR